MGVRTWTDEAVETLTKLWNDGVPAGEIAARLGMTRGMVTGKRWGLGLPPRTGEVVRAAEAANARRAASIYRNVAPEAWAKRQEALQTRVARVEASMVPLAGSNPKPWELRKPGECAYPVDGWGASTMSCCEPVEEGQGRPYCYGHLEILAGRPWPPNDASRRLAASQWEVRPVLTVEATARKPEGSQTGADGHGRDQSSPRSDHAGQAGYGGRERRSFGSAQRRTAHEVAGGQGAELHAQG